jgi:hypothetical protein
MRAPFATIKVEYSIESTSVRRNEDAMKYPPRRTGNKKITTRINPIN